MKKIFFAIWSCSLLLSLGLIQVIPDSFADHSEDLPVAEKVFDCECVAFRLDDVQDHFLNEPSKKLIETFKENNLPYTLGILSNDFGEDEELVSLVRELANDEEYQFEISSHGTVHENFTQLTDEQQKVNMKESLENLEKTLGIYPKLFIPPLGEFNEGTIFAMKENGVTHFSPSFVPGNDSIIPVEDQNFYQIPSGAVTAEYSSDDQFVGIPAETTFSQIEENIQNYGYSVVTMHPMEFGVIEDGELVNEINWEQFDELDNLIELIRESEIPIVNIQDISNSSSQNDSGSIPDWIKNIFIWYGDEKIGEDELKNALQFLIREKILIVD